MSCGRNQGKPAAAKVAVTDLVKLKANDDEVFEVDRGLIRHSINISDLVKKLDMCDEDFPGGIPLANVNGRILKKVLEWAEHHKDDEVPTSLEAAGTAERDVTQWDKEFFDVDPDIMTPLMVAAERYEMYALQNDILNYAVYKTRGFSAARRRGVFAVASNLTFREVLMAKMRRQNRAASEHPPYKIDDLD